VNTGQLVITIAIIAAATFLTRSLPFLIFSAEQKPPGYVRYLGTVLPCATIAMLVVYCLKDTAFFAWPYGIPELISIAAVALLQLRTRNMLISVAVGLALYMVLIRTIFIAA
jgi:branched-subunit amino acid transport protein AzlD